MTESWRLEATFWISLNLLGVRCGHSHRDCKSMKEKARYPEAVIEEITWQENAWAPMPLCKWVNETKRVYYNWLEKKKNCFSLTVGQRGARWLTRFSHRGWDDFHHRTHTSDLFQAEWFTDHWWAALRFETWSPSLRPTWTCWPLRGNWTRPFRENAWRFRKPSRNPLWYNI